MLIYLKPTSFKEIEKEESIEADGAYRKDFFYCDKGLDRVGSSERHRGKKMVHGTDGPFSG